MKKLHEMIFFIKVVISKKLPDPIHVTGFSILGFISILCLRGAYIVKQHLYKKTINPEFERNVDVQNRTFGWIRF